MRVERGNCIEVMRRLIDEGVRVEAVVTDPPYELRFMGRGWDGTGIAFDPETWRLCLALLKPGGHLLAFGIPKQFGFMQVAVAEAGFELRDVVLWIFGSGFPKSHDVSKAIDKAARGVPHGGSDPTSPNHGKFKGGCSEDNPRGQGFGAGPGAFMAEAGQTTERALVPEAREWDGWGTALKPACEMIVLARKPLSEKTVAANVLEHGCGGLNVDGCRVEGSMDGSWGGSNQDCQEGRIFNASPVGSEYRSTPHSEGRWPANVCHDGSPEVLEAFARFGNEKGQAGSISGDEPSLPAKGDVVYGFRERVSFEARNDTGTAARFFYSAKADKGDRLGSKHPTVKPVGLMRWLVRMVTPPGGTVLDPFAGTGTTGMACLAEGFNAILIEREAEYIADIKRRLAHVNGGDTPLFKEAAP